MEGTVKKYPHFIKAKTAIKLQQMMFSNNVNDAMQYTYKIVHDGKDWYAWYDKVAR